MTSGKAQDEARAPVLRYAGIDYQLAPEETVLSALLRHGLNPPHSCRRGTCLSCLLRAESGPLPEGAQEGLRETLRAQNYFLACQCIPTAPLSVLSADAGDLYRPARVIAAEHLSPEVTRLFLEPKEPFDYHAGQFVNLRRADGLTRSYSLASVSGEDRLLELHVKRLPGGEMSHWIGESAAAGTEVALQGPNGASFYLPGRPDQPLLLIGTGTGLAPIMGIARAAISAGHRGPIRLYHGARARTGLYLHDALRLMKRTHDIFDYVGCISGGERARGCFSGRADDCAFADHPHLAGWRVFLCGNPPMVQAARMTAYLAGAALEDIHADPFELRDKRAQPRTLTAREQAA